MALVKLWYSPGACSLASHILLNETGTEFEAVKLDVKAGYPDEFRHINPKMRVPVLSIDGQIITETPAIMTAIAQLAPNKHLMGTTNLEIVRAYEWLNWLSGTLHGQGFGGLIRSHRFSDDPSTYPSIQAKATRTIEECFERIEKVMSGAHAVGGRFTAVDAFLYVFYRWGAFGGTNMKDEYPKFTDMVENLVKRESVQAALKAEDVESFVPMLSIVKRISTG